MPTDGKRLTPSSLTDQQRRALETRGTSVAVSAGAGCGKTFVLTERFLAELQPQSQSRDRGQQSQSRDRGSRLSQVAAITFTERAAREMRDRIRAACNRRLRDCPDEEIDYWMSLVRELDSARISTIHSFCASLLRSHAVEAGLDPRFRVLDGAQAGTLLFELTDDVLRDRLAGRQEAALALVARFGLDRLRSMIARLLAVRQDIDWQFWRNESADGLVARWEEFWRSDTLPRLMRRLTDSAAAGTVLEIAARRPSDHPKMQQRFAALSNLLTEITKPRPAVAPHKAATGGRAEKAATVGRAEGDASDGGGFVETLAAIREAARVQGGGTKKNWSSEEDFEEFKDAAAELREEIKRFEQRGSFDAVASRPAAEAALLAVALAAEVADTFEQRKRELASLDFNDLLILARRLLTGPRHGGLRKRLAAQTRLLLVDEFQDTDPLQVELVKALCDNEHLRGKLFLVGDYKQSIYRFRGADPRVFGRLREEFPADGRLPLSLNFRSQPAVLEFVNALFAGELGPEYEPLRAARPQVGPTPAVEFLWAGDDSNHKAATVGRASDETATVDRAGDSNQPPVANEEARPTVAAMYDDLGPRERLRRREAEWIARRIRAMLESGEKTVWDADAARAGAPAVRTARLGDVAILFRALTNVEYYEEALQRYGIDYYLVGGRAFYAQQEIFDLLNLLRTLNSRCDEVSLAGALRSPLFSLHDETLFWLARHGANLSPLPLGEGSGVRAGCLDENSPLPLGEGSGVRAGCLAAGLFADILPPELDPEQRERATFAAATIRELRAMKDRLPVARLIQEALNRTGYDAVLLAEFLGERKLANLHKLIEQARSFDQSGVFALSDFITQLAEFVARQPDEPPAATCPESIDAVKLMSIHQSKGLEFPVVIVADVGRPRRVQGPPIAFSPQLGPMLKDPDAATGYDLFMTAEYDEDAAEHSRLLYVAATRAADRLILSSGVERLDRPAGPWMEMLARRFDLTTGRQLAGGQCSEVRGQRSEVREQREAAGDPPNPQSLTLNPSLVAVVAAPPPVRSKPADLRVRRDLVKIVEKAGQMAADGAGRRPKYVGPPEIETTASRWFSFSRLSGELHAGWGALDADDLDESAAAEPRLDPRGLGTLVHAVLEQVDFARPEDVQELVERLAPEHLPPEGLNLGGPVEMIGRFLRSPRAAELAAAKEVYRELEFILAWPFHKAAAGGRAPGESRPAVFIRGYIDCLYRDARGRWRLIDFKTGDDATPDHHEMQMLGYAYAVEEIKRISVDELTLCFLRSEKEHSFNWNAANRSKLIEMVSDALSERRALAN